MVAVGNKNPKTLRRQPDENRRSKPFSQLPRTQQLLDALKNAMIEPKIPWRLGQKHKEGEVAHGPVRVFEWAKQIWPNIKKIGPDKFNYDVATSHVEPGIALGNKNVWCPLPQRI
ncbi:hypothetical protein Droror1_Dr00001864 [Drosera rotundifolia]